VARNVQRTVLNEITKRGKTMSRNLISAATLPASPDRLFDMYLNPDLHAAFTGASAEIAPHAGAEFRAFDNALSGRILHLIPKRMIVQSWRASHWEMEDLDSTLVLTFWPDEERTRIDLVQVNVAEHDFAAVSQGWEKYYWTPWRKYLEEKG
jgi:activator of HSP90 ATPase